MKKQNIILAVAASLLISSCSQVDETTSPDTGGKISGARSNNVIVYGSDVLEKMKSRSTRSGDQDDIMTFTFAHEDIPVGADIGGVGLNGLNNEPTTIMFIAEPTEDFPNGIIRRVVETTSSDGDVQYQTAQGEVSDVFDSLYIDQVISTDDGLEIEDINATHPDITVTEVRGNDGRIHLQIEGRGNERAGYAKEFSKEFGDNVTLNGSIGFSFDIHTKIDIRWHWLKPYLNEFYFGTSVKQNGKLELIVEGEASVDKEFELLSAHLSPITIWAAGVPIVLVPKVSFIASVDGTIHGEMVMEAHQSFEGKLGVRYKNNHLNPESYKKLTYGFTPPNYNITAHVRAGVGPRLEMKFYGIAGPHAGLELYDSLYCNVSGGAGSATSVSGGNLVALRGYAGIRLDVLGKRINESADLFRTDISHTRL